jgi:transcriptional regulator with XRE-family HTH domain
MTTHEKETLREVGSTIREARRHSGMSLRDLAEVTGLSKGNLSKIENGGNVTIATLYRICRMLDLHPRYVLPDFNKL